MIEFMKSEPICNNVTLLSRLVSISTVAAHSTKSISSPISPRYYKNQLILLNKFLQMFLADLTNAFLVPEII